MAKVAAAVDYARHNTSGKWIWKDETNTLEFTSNNPNADRQEKRRRAKEGNKRNDRVASSVGKANAMRGKNQRGKNAKSPRPPIKATSDHSTVTLDDVKGVALEHVPNDPELEMLSEHFDGIYSNSQFDNFLLHLLRYFHCFFEKQQWGEKIRTTTYIEPSLTEKQAYADSKAKLKVAQKLLGQSYCMLVLGLDLEPQHHMYCGQSRVSSTLKDRSMFETLYSFCAYFVWIAFRRKDYELVRKEVGRMLRSDTFNPAIRVKNAPDEQKKDKEPEKKLTPAEYRRLHPKRPAIKSVISQRSPAVVAILPSPKEEATWLFEKPESAEALVKASIEAQEQDIVEDAFYLDKKTIKIGIVGEPLSQFNPQTLTPQGDGNEDEENEGEEGEKQTAGEEPPKEQNPPDQKLSRQQTAASHVTTDAAYSDEE